VTISRTFERAVPFTLRSDESDSENDGLTLEGYAAVFNQATEIDSWEGNFQETIAPGAFRKSIRERTPVLQFDHGRHPLLGSIPIGRIESLAEDTEGLAVSARLSDNWLIEPVRHAIRDRAVKGMSFRFEVVREEWRDKDGKLIKEDELLSLLWNPGDRAPIQRTLKELKVPELGPVVFPAYEGTSVDVRAQTMASEMRRDPYMVRALREQLARGVFLNERHDKDTAERNAEIAKALLFDLPSRTVDGPSEESESAPLDVEHPQEETPQNDAPLRDEHPSTTEKDADPDLPMTIHYRSRQMARIVASISEDKYAGRA
jgi:HK97 family phage prohead protease